MTIQTTKLKNPYKEYEFVDLGLPSGNLWATRNIGATSITDYGLYFAWGETTGYTRAEVNSLTRWFTRDAYQYNNGDNGYSEYNETDGKDTLDDEDDAACVNIGNGWHMPTTSEYNELFDYTTSEQVTNYLDSGINGRLFTSTVNGNLVFFPYSGGWVQGRGWDYVNNYARYWSKDLFESQPPYANVASIYNGNPYIITYSRQNGATIRPVINKSDVDSTWALNDVKLNDTSADYVYLGLELIYVAEELRPIEFEDPAVETILLDWLDTTNKGYLTPKDLAAVTDMQQKFNTYRNPSNIITKFNEFKYFTGLTAAINSIFYNLTLLLEITFPPITNRLMTWGGTNSPLEGCTSLAKCDLNGITFAEPGAGLNGLYKKCQSLPYDESIIPTGWTAIGTSMFSQCRNMDTIVIPEGILSINGAAFSSSNTQIVITPTTLTTLVANDMFRDSVASSRSMYLRNASLMITITSTTGYNKACTVYVPDALLSQYLADTNWLTMVSNYGWTLKSDSELPSELQQYKLNDE